MTDKIDSWQSARLLRVFAFAIIGMLLAMLAAPGANAQTRSLKIHSLNTGEKATIIFKRNNKFLPAGLKRLNFILRDWRRNEPTRMDPKLLDLIWEIYRQAGSKEYITVISAYRSPKTNNMLRKRSRGVAKTSQHTLGKAMDFFLPDVKLVKLRNLGLIKQVGGVGYYPRSGSPFVHIDTGRVRHWPRMTRKQLVRVFPRGKTMHIPSDGKPLPGYKQAVAAYEARNSKSATTLLARGPRKKPKDAFKRLAGLSAREDNADRYVNAVPTPRRVETSTNAPPKPVAPEIPKTPDLPNGLPGIANVPAPRTSPRNITPANELVATQNNAAAPDTNLDAKPEFIIPIPKIRPQTPTVLVARAEIEPNPVRQISNSEPVNELPLETINENQLRVRLTALATEQLRTRLSAPPRPSAEVGSSFETALISPAAIPRNNPVLTRLTPPAQPETPAVIPVIENTATVTIIPTQRPSVQVAKAVESLPDNKPEEPVVEVAQSKKTISDLILAAIPIPAPRRPAIAQALVEAPPHPVADTSNEATILAFASPSMKKQNKPERFVLATSFTIKSFDELRAPAYGRAAIWQSPKTVLSTGFTPSGTIQHSSSFTGKAVRFQPFTRFN